MGAQLDLSSQTIATSYVQLLHTGHTSGLEAAGTGHFVTDGNGEESILSLDQGRVGIGLESPSVLFHVSNGDGTDPAYAPGTTAVFQNNDDAGDHCRVDIISGTSGSGILQFGDESDENRGGILYDQGADRMELFTAAASSNLAIIANGDVGIGTTAPASAASFAGPVLELKGAGPVLVLHETDSGTPEWQIGVNGETLEIYDDSDLRFVIGSTGYVGCGSSGPSNNLEIGGKSGEACRVLVNAVSGQDSSYGLAEAGVTMWKIKNNTGDNSLYIVDASDDGAILTQNETSAWDWSSDINLKTDISPISDALSKVNQISGVNYKWKKYKEGASNPNPEEITEDRWAEMRPLRDINRIGVIAQEIKEVMPEAVNTDTDGQWTVKRGLLVPLLIEAVKELSVKVDVLENNNKQGDSSNEQEESAANSGGSNGGSSSSESSGQDNSGVEGNSSESSDTVEGSSGDSEAVSNSSESGDDNGDEASGGSGSNSANDAEGGSGGDDSGGESLPDGEPSDEWTKDELKAYMEANEIAFNSGDTKQDLLDKIGSFNG